MLAAITGKSLLTGCCESTIIGSPIAFSFEPSSEWKLAVRFVCIDVLGKEGEEEMFPRLASPTQ
jgi:hypothetical protein